MRGAAKHQAGQVSTTAGGTIAAGTLGTFNVAVIPPSALGTAPDVTIVNMSSAEYHARQLVRAIRGDRWDE